MVIAGMVMVAIPWCRAKQLLHSGKIDEALEVLPHDASIRVMRALLRAEQARALQTQDSHAAVDVVNASVSDLNTALREGGHVEVAEFARGWLLLDSNPVAARESFERVRGVARSRRGAWLGAALAEIRCGNGGAAPALLVEECLATPSFVGSGWWLTIDLRPYRTTVLDLLSQRLELLATDSGRRVWARNEAADFGALVRCIAGQLSDRQLAEALRDERRRETMRGILNEGTADKSLGLDSAAREEKLDAFFERQLGWMLPPGYGARVDACIREWPQHERVSRAFSASDHAVQTLVTAYAPMPGFGVRMRNPYAQRIRSVMPEIHNVIAECFLDFLFPQPGWILDQEFTSGGWAAAPSSTDG